MREFHCDFCDKQSRFLKKNRRVSIVNEWQTAAVTLDETRSYACERCGTENRITQPSGAWAVIDASS